MHSGFPSQKQWNAFTLIELMVVCLIVAILTAMIIPEMRGSYQDALLRSTSRKLMDVFDLAYSRAVSLDQQDRVRLDPDTGRYVVEQQLEEGGQERFVALKDVSDGEGELDNRISIQIRNPGGDLSDETPDSTAAEASTDNRSHQASDNVFTFYPDGTADGREVILRDRDGFGLALRVNSITARVNIVELKRQ